MKESREIIRTAVHDIDIDRNVEIPVVPAGTYPSYAAESAQGLQLLDYWRAIRKRLWLVLGITVLFTTLAAIYMARKPDVFRASAVVQVDLEQTNPDVVTTDRQRTLPNADPAYINTQLQLLWSDSLLRRAIEREEHLAHAAFAEALANIEAVVDDRAGRYRRRGRLHQVNHEMFLGATLGQPEQAPIYVVVGEGPPNRPDPSHRRPGRHGGSSSNVAAATLGRPHVWGQAGRAQGRPFRERAQRPREAHAHVGRICPLWILHGGAA